MAWQITLLQLPALRLDPRRLAHARPLAVIQPTIVVTVEALQQAGEVTLPLAYHRALRQRQVEGLGATGQSEADTAYAQALMKRVRDIALACDTQQLFEADEIIGEANVYGIAADFEDKVTF